MQQIISCFSTPVQKGYQDIFHKFSSNISEFSQIRFLKAKRCMEWSRLSKIVILYSKDFLQNTSFFFILVFSKQFSVHLIVI